MKLIDLSHTITDGLITYKGLPAPIICDYLSRKDSKDLYDGDTTFQIGKIEMVANTGTYIDCPFHRYGDGADLSQTPLAAMAALPCIVIRHDYVHEGLAIPLSKLQGLELRGKAVLFHTGWDQHWNTDAYYEDNPFLSIDAAHELVRQGAVLAGIDSYNIDDTRKKTRPIHSILLKEGILIVEHLTGLHKVPNADFLFSAVPPKIEGMGTFPVRAFAQIEQA